MNKLWVRLSLGFGAMVLVAVFLVATAGIFVGAVPGLTGAMLIALTLPLTFSAEHGSS